MQALAGPRGKGWRGCRPLAAGIAGVQGSPSPCESHCHLPPHTQCCQSYLHPLAASPGSFPMLCRPRGCSAPPRHGPGAKPSKREGEGAGWEEQTGEGGWTPGVSGWAEPRGLGSLEPSWDVAKALRGSAWCVSRRTLLRAAVRGSHPPGPSAVQSMTQYPGQLLPLILLGLSRAGPAIHAAAWVRAVHTVHAASSRPHRVHLLLASFFPRRHLKCGPPARDYLPPWDPMAPF